VAQSGRLALKTDRLVLETNQDVVISAYQNVGTSLVSWVEGTKTPATTDWEMTNSTAAFTLSTISGAA
jgi:hypothetical protein